MLTRRLLIAGALAATFGIMSTTASAAPDAEKAKTFMQGLADRAVEAVKGSATDKEKQEKLRVILRDGFDVNTIGKFALGKHRRGADPEVLKAYLVTVEDFIVMTYSRRFGEFAGQKLEITGTTPEDANDIFVLSKIMRPGKEPIPIRWRVRGNDDKIRIIDVEVEGTSQALTYRQDFTSVIQSKGNGVTGLTEELKAKIAKLRTEGG